MGVAHALHPADDCIVLEGDFARLTGRVCRGWFVGHERPVTFGDKSEGHQNHQEAY